MAHYTGNNPVNRIDPTGNHFRNPQNVLNWGQLYDICQTHPEYGWQPCDDWEYFHDHAPGYVDPTPPVTPPENPPGGTTPPPGGTTPPPGGTTPPPGGTTTPPGETNPPPGGTTPPPPVTPPVQPPPPTPGEIDAASNQTKTAASGPVPVTTYVVQPGDTLSAIALRFYGDASMYEKIWHDNSDQIENPDVIKVGQELKILEALPKEVRKLLPTPGVPAPSPSARSTGSAYANSDDSGLASVGSSSFNTQDATAWEGCRDSLNGCMGQSTSSITQDTPKSAVAQGGNGCIFITASETVELGKNGNSACATDPGSGALVALSNATAALSMGENGQKVSGFGEGIAGEMSSPAANNGSKAHSQALELSGAGTYQVGNSTVIVTPSLVSVVAPTPGSLSNVQARQWYLSMEARIPVLIDKTAPLEVQARQAFNLRNEIRTTTRNAMSDRVTAERLMRDEPNMTWQQIVTKYADKGITGDALYTKIIESSQRSRPSVNAALGLKP